VLRDQFAQMIKSLRDERGLNQEQLAELSGLSVREIGRIENAKCAASLDSLEKLAHAFQIHPKDLLDVPWPMSTRDVTNP
jgi:transcriptional regulator with XRE-family HTH domain